MFPGDIGGTHAPDQKNASAVDLMRHALITGAAIDDHWGAGVANGRGEARRDTGREGGDLPERVHHPGSYRSP